MARAPDFDLAKALASPSFTPAVKDAPALVELVVGGEEPATARAAVALAKLGDVGRAAIEKRLAGGGPVGGDTAELGDASTARLVRALGQLARGGDAAARASLIARAGDPHVRVRRAAINALGKLDGDDVRAVLVARWDAADVPPDEKRALAEALGKVGGDEALARLQQAPATDDAELERRRKRGALMAQRTATRSEESTIDASAALPHALNVVLRCKPGLATLLAEEATVRGLGKLTANVDSAVIARLDAGARWDQLYASRLWSTAAFEVPLAKTGEIVDRVRSTLTSRAVRETLAAMTRGPIRYRIGFKEGHRRALVWQLAHALSAEYVNDPTSSTWEFLVDDERGIIELAPKKAQDPRFAWRVAEVPAASHPTVAAALAFVGGARDGDRVWDPFAGSGAELVERAKLGAFASLAGTDLDEAALAAARDNVVAAGVQAQLARADARKHAAGPVDLIITNPPLGSRVQLDARALLVGALPHFVKQLAPRGRLVWITPAPKHTTPVAEGLGLRRTRAFGVDLGGVRGTLERWER